MPIIAIEHVQLAMPAGMEQAARNFYQGLLGIPEVPKPPELAKRRLKQHQVKVVDDEPLEGYLRVYVADPFDNRIELMERR